MKTVSRPTFIAWLPCSNRRAAILRTYGMWRDGGGGWNRIERQNSNIRLHVETRATSKPEAPQTTGMGHLITWKRVVEPVEHLPPPPSNAANIVNSPSDEVVQQKRERHTENTRGCTGTWLVVACCRYVADQSPRFKTRNRSLVLGAMGMVDSHTVRRGHSSSASSSSAQIVEPRLLIFFWLFFYFIFTASSNIGHFSHTDKPVLSNRTE